ncbi:MAG: DoxX family protein [Sulfurimonadaceae bacterium]|nr:DoxX family protein [Sulfurimonadaceae bacterium]
MSPELAKLSLRLSVGILILFHGIHKIIYGVSGVKALLSKAGLPEFFAYGVYVGEVIIPVFIILGLYARIASLFLAFTMLMAMFLAYWGSFFSLSKQGAPLIELPLLYFILAIIIFLQGSGKFSVNNK